MTFDASKHVTVANCPTRAALEKEPKAHVRINGKAKRLNAAKKREAHAANLAQRGEDSRRQNRGGTSTKVKK